MPNKKNAISSAEQRRRTEQSKRGNEPDKIPTPSDKLKAVPKGAISPEVKQQIQLDKVSDRDLLKMIYNQTGYIQSLQTQLQQAQHALNQINAEGQRRSLDPKGK